ncbi:MAG: EthD domain-containing protein [bacterium]
MIKAVIFVKRRKDLTREQFRDYWLTQHSKLEKENAEKNWVRKIVASFTVEDDSLPEPPFDGMVELYFDSIEDMKKDVQGEQRKIMRADEENFCDHSEEQLVVITQEYLMAVKTPCETTL